MSSLKAISILVLLAVISGVLAVSGCTSPSATPAPTAAPTTTPAPTTVPSGTAALSVTGKVTTPLNLALSDLDAYTQHAASWKNNAGNSSYDGTGPYVLDILNKAGLASDAANVTFASTADKYNITVTLADLKSKYNDSIVAHNYTGIDKQGAAIQGDGKTLLLIVPNGGGKNQVKNIDAITVS